jgi:DNA polymerase-3 subunit delta'
VFAVLDRHPHARSVLSPALTTGGRASHAYLFHGPGGADQRAVARELAAELLAEGSADPDSARARVRSGAHPDLTWVVPSGAHEILVSDIAEPVVAAASKTPFEASRRVFVIERVDELGDEAANRMLKTLEEPARYVHLILLTDRLTDVLPTISSRCQLVRFDASSEEEVATQLEAPDLSPEEALACAKLSLGDFDHARELAGIDGAVLREHAERLARAVLAGEASQTRPWVELLAAVRARGETVRQELEQRAVAELELYPAKERKRVETEWGERVRRARRRVETQALDLALQLVGLWYADLAALAWGAPELVRHVHRFDVLRDEPSVEASRLLGAVELVEETRRRFELNVSEELAVEALSYRLERLLAR